MRLEIPNYEKTRTLYFHVNLTTRYDNLGLEVY